MQWGMGLHTVLKKNVLVSAWRALPFFRGFDGTGGGGIDEAERRKVRRDGQGVPPAKAEPCAERSGRFDPLGGLVLL